MRNKPILYNGYDIDASVIKRIKDIAKERYDEIIYENYFSDIGNLYELCCLHDTSMDEEKVILGDDWFISYANRDNNIEITEWVALEKSKNKMAQTKEMLIAIKDILLLGKRISAFMRRDSSYQFYLKYLNQGYFQELRNNIVLDFCRPQEMKDIVDRLRKKYNSYEEYFNDENSDKYPGYDKFVFHNVTFELTKKFTDRYKKKT